MAETNAEMNNMLGELQRSMTKLSESMKSMSTDIREMNNREKKKEKQADAKKATDEVNAQQARILKMLKGESLDEEDAKDGKSSKKDDKTQIKLLLQLVNSEKKKQKEQADANKYLKQLKEITEKNYKLSVGEAKLNKIQRRADMTPFGRKADIIKGGAFKFNEALIKTGQSDSNNPYSKLAGGLARMSKSMFTKQGGVNKLVQKGKEYTSGSRGRQYEIEKLRKDLKHLGKEKSALQYELDEATKTGDQEKISQIRNQLEAKQAELKQSAGKMSGTMTEEYLYQSGRQDKRMKGVTADSSMGKQFKSNIEASIMEQYNPNKDSKGSRRKTRRGKGTLSLKGMKSNTSSQTDGGDMSGGDSGGGVGGVSSMRQFKTLSTVFWRTPIKNVKSAQPKTVGEYISGIYNQLKSGMGGMGGMGLDGKKDEKSGGSFLGKWAKRLLMPVLATAAGAVVGIGIGKALQGAYQKFTGVKSGAGLQKGQGIEGLGDDALLKATQAGSSLAGGKITNFAKGMGASRGSTLVTASGRQLEGAAATSRLNRMSLAKDLKLQKELASIKAAGPDDGFSIINKGKSRSVSSEAFAKRLERTRALEKARDAKALGATDDVAKVGLLGRMKGGLSKIPGVSKIGAIGKNIAKVPGMKTGLKVAGSAAKFGAKTVGKFLPGVGLGIGALSAKQRWSEGDKFGAVMEGLGGVASLVPGLGTAASMGISGMLAARDLTEASMVKGKEAEQEKLFQEGLKRQKEMFAKQRASKANASKGITQDVLKTTLNVDKAAASTAEVEAEKMRALGKIIAEESVKSMSSPEYKDNVKAQSAAQASDTASAFTRG